MGWIISMIFAVVICGGLWLIAQANMKKVTVYKEQYKRSVSDKINYRTLSILAQIILVIWVGGHTLIKAIYQIPAGNIGVVYTFGAITSQVSEGLNFVAPWKGVRVATIQVQRHPFEKLNAFSQETQDVFVKATLNIRVSPTAIQELFRSVGPTYFEVLVAPRVAQIFKDETVKYKSVDIAPNREIIRKAVRERLENELSSRSIEVVDLLLDNIDFNPEFKKAIENKQIASQKALEEEQKVNVAKFQADQKVKTAEGEGNAIYTIAEKQALANKKLAESLTPQLIQYSLIQKLGDKIQVMLLPAGQQFILGSDVLNLKALGSEKK